MITLVEIDRNQVRIGVDAPKSLPIWREELLPGRMSRPGDTAPPAAPTGDRP